MIKSFLLLLFIFSLTDFFYLFLMKDKFKNLINSIQKSSLKLKIFPTILCYLFLNFLIFYFIINKNHSLLDAFLLGIAVYGVFETTNLAIFKKWDYKIAIIDTLWGGILFLITTFFYKKLTNNN